MPPGASDGLRVALVCRTAWPSVGGLETVLGGLAAALRDRGHLVEIVTLAPGPTRHDGIRVRRLRRLGPRRYPFGAGLRAAVRGFDVVHVHGLDGLADQLVRCRDIGPVGISTHGGYFHTARQRLLKSLALHTVTRRTFARAAAVWFTSEADRIRLGGGVAHGEVLRNGVETDRFAGLRRRPEHGRWLLYGRVDHHKGHADAIDAASRLPPGATLHIVGPGPALLVDGLRRRAARAGVRLVVHGRLEEAGLRRQVERCEVALFPSRYEGFGLALAELMAAGVPVVASDIPAFCELVQHGRTGLLVPWRRPDEAARLLGALGSWNLVALGDAARLAVRSWSWDERVRPFEAAYRRLRARVPRA